MICNLVPIYRVDCVLQYTSVVIASAAQCALDFTQYGGLHLVFCITAPLTLSGHYSCISELPETMPWKPHSACMASSECCLNSKHLEEDIFIAVLYGGGFGSSPWHSPILGIDCIVVEWACFSLNDWYCNGLHS